MTEEPKQLHAVVHGIVHGVGFRHSTFMRAVELGVKGWVRNRADGTVEVSAEGPRQQLNELLAYLHEGPPAARVYEVDVVWYDTLDHFEHFEIR